MRRLVDMQYERNDMNLVRGKFRMRGDTLTMLPAYEELAVRIDFFGDEVERIIEIDPLTGELLAERDAARHLPGEALRHVAGQARAGDRRHRDRARASASRSCDEAGQDSSKPRGSRSAPTTTSRSLREAGYCSGIENYSRHLARRGAGQHAVDAAGLLPGRLADVHRRVAHRAAAGARHVLTATVARKQTLVDYGFRLPSALDNRPLNFAEFEDHLDQVIFVSATPGPVRAASTPSRSSSRSSARRACIDPVIEVQADARARSTTCWTRCKQRIGRGERTLVTTLTKKMAEDLADYLQEMGVRTHYLHSEIDTLERVEILRDLRLGVYDVVVGINLLREGLDLPEVSLVCILDADKEGYLRSGGSLIQTIGRAARHVDGHVIMYADKITDSMQLRHRRDGPPPRDPDRLQRRARHLARGHHQGDPRHHRPDHARSPRSKADYNVEGACRRTSWRAWSSTSRSR